MSAKTAETERAVAALPVPKADQGKPKPKLSRAHARVLLTRLEAELSRAKLDLDKTEGSIQALRRRAGGQQKRVEQLKDRIREIDGQ